ncbi:calcium/sodium antiporter [Wansuia hejianensis]|uniref:Calcium/sodium antiporter n=1 Tax=Wansuia hejianensis TaxID=2763667 RepID=A0A926F055_9FIRM|nr:calcium/sodium antiporter [Wansuia hejianensis]MBC8590901.1 calcium/sodium antiporter [Wansuia hejianensis]
MAIIFTFLLFFIGIFIIVKGGNWFVDSAIWIAEVTGISFGLIGATIISLATTAPEFFVSTIASSEGFSDMALGNAIGSVICNIALIISLCALIKPIKINSSFFGIKGLMMVSYMCIFLYLASDGIVTKSEGLFLISLVVFFILLNLLEHNKNSSLSNKPTKRKRKKGELVICLFKFIVGGLFIILGADILVETGVEIAKFLRIPKQIISLTLLAIGTSLPELVTSLTAIFKNKEDITIGNILGANILNISIILGTCALVNQNGLIVPMQTLFLDVPVAILLMIIFIVPGIIRDKIGRFTGFVLFSLYLAYIKILL